MFSSALYFSEDSTAHYLGQASRSLKKISICHSIEHHLQRLQTRNDNPPLRVHQVVSASVDDTPKFSGSLMTEAVRDTFPFGARNYVDPPDPDTWTPEASCPMIQ